MRQNSDGTDNALEDMQKQKRGFLEEIWKEIEGYSGRYEISNMGRVKSYAQDRKNGKIKTGNPTFKGYRTILLYDGKGNSKWHPVHRLVASAFIDNPTNLPQVNHKDENKANNTADNLEWCTNEYNMNYGTRNQRVAEKNRCCPITSLKIKAIDKNGNVEYYESIGEAERKTGSNHSNIVRALKGRRKHCGDRQWFYC